LFHADVGLIVGKSDSGAIDMSSQNDNQPPSAIRNIVSGAGALWKSMVTERLAERAKVRAEVRRDQLISEESSLLGSWAFYLDAGVPYSKKIDDDGKVSIVVGGHGQEIAEIKLTVGEMGAGQPDYNGVVIHRFADNEKRYYTFKDSKAPIDFLNGGDGISPNHIDPNGYPAVMRRR
jgi:hypothetical protein